MLYQTPLYFFLIFLECRSNQSILKEISLGCSLEGLMLKLKLQYFGHLMGRADSFEKTLMLGKMRARGEGDNRAWHHRLNGHGFGWTLAVDDGQEGLVCSSPRGRKESDMPERLNWTELSVDIGFKGRMMYVFLLSQSVCGILIWGLWNGSTKNCMNFSVSLQPCHFWVLSK